MEFICWKWKGKPGYRSTFGPETVNVLRSMIERNYSGPHRLTCITDDADGIDDRVRIIPLWKDHAEIPSPHGGNNPSCYRRLKAFSREAAELIAPRFVSIDLDCVIVGDITPLFAGGEPFKIWGDTARNTPYNGGLFMLEAGARPQVWENFDPVRSPSVGRKLGYVGSDQAWIGAVLGKNEPKWSARDGVHSYRNEIAPKGGALPSGAKVVLFHGAVDPWSPNAMRHPFVQQHYR